LATKKKNITSTKWFTYLIEALLIVALSFLAYSNAIQNDYNLDDAYIAPLDSQNEILKEIPDVAFPIIIRSRYNEAEGATYGYRPLGKASMVYEYQLWGLNPTYSHIVNIAFFAINVLLLLVLLRKLPIVGINIPKQVIYIGLLLFIFHPIHTEVVCSIKNREEILCFIFLITALIFYLQFFKTSKYYFLIPFLAALALGMLAKQTIFNIFGWLILLSIVGSRFGDVNLKKLYLILKSAAVLAVSVVLYYIIFVYVPSTLAPAEISYDFTQNPYKNFPGINSIPNGIQTLFFYVKKLILPYPLLFYYGYDMLPVQNWKMILPYVGILTILILTIYVVRSYTKKSNFVVPFWIVVFAISIFPFSNLFSIIYVTGIVGERLAYQASFAFCIIVAFLIYNGINVLLKTQNDKQKRVVLAMVLLPILSTYFVITFTRSAHWENKLTLFENDIKFLSSSARANSMLANAYMKSVEDGNVANKQEVVNKAKHYFKQSIKVYPQYNDSWIKLGLIYARHQNDLDSTLICLNKVEKDSSKSHLDSIELLGDIFQTQQKNNKEALKYYLQYWSINNSNQRIYEKIQNILFSQLRYQDVIFFSQLAIQNEWVEGYVDKADALYQLGNIHDAITNYRLALQNGYVSVEIENKIKSIQ
jgi:tetratricopeptide (TPR) repeat protein